MMNDIRIADTVSQVSAMQVEFPLSWILIPSALLWMGFGLYLMYADMKAYGAYMRGDRENQHY